jgi:hypothetical protein
MLPDLRRGRPKGALGEPVFVAQTPAAGGELSPAISIGKRVALPTGMAAMRAAMIEWEPLPSLFIPQKLSSP